MSVKRNSSRRNKKDPVKTIRITTKDKVIENVVNGVSKFGTIEEDDGIIYIIFRENALGIDYLEEKIKIANKLLMDKRYNEDVIDSIKCFIKDMEDMISNNRDNVICKYEIEDFRMKFHEYAKGLGLM